MNTMPLGGHRLQINIDNFGRMAKRIWACSQVDVLEEEVWYRKTCIVLINITNTKLVLTNIFITYMYIVCYNYTYSMGKR